MTVWRTVATYLFDTCTHKCGYCELAASGLVLDMPQLDFWRDEDTVRSVTQFFNRRTSEDEKWLLQLTGGDPLLMPNLALFCSELFAACNRVAFYTSLDAVHIRHPSYRFLLEHGAPDVDYVMASMHPESQLNEDVYFARLAALKAAGHNVFLRYVSPPSRLDALDRLAERCRALDVCFYPTTVFTPNYPASYTESERLALMRHFSSHTQRLQLEGGADVRGQLCTSGSTNFAVKFPAGVITPCCSNDWPILGNVFEDTLTINDRPSPCPNQAMVCTADIHFQQDVLVGAEDSATFQRQQRGYVAPLPIVEQDAWLASRSFTTGGATAAFGNVADETRLFYETGEVMQAYKGWRDWKKSIEQT